MARTPNLPALWDRAVQMTPEEIAIWPAEMKKFLSRCPPIGELRSLMYELSDKYGQSRFTTFTQAVMGSYTKHLTLCADRSQPNYRYCERVKEANRIKNNISDEVKVSEDTQSPEQNNEEPTTKAHNESTKETHIGPTIEAGTKSTHEHNTEPTNGAGFESGKASGASSSNNDVNSSKDISSASIERPGVEMESKNVESPGSITLGSMENSRIELEEDTHENDTGTADTSGTERDEQTDRWRNGNGEELGDSKNSETATQSTKSPDLETPNAISTTTSSFVSMEESSAIATSESFSVDDAENAAGESKYSNLTNSKKNSPDNVSQSASNHETTPISDDKLDQKETTSNGPQNPTYPDVPKADPTEIDHHIQQLKPEDAKLELTINNFTESKYNNGTRSVSLNVA